MWEEERETGERALEVKKHHKEYSTEADREGSMWQRTNRHTPWRQPEPRGHGNTVCLRMRNTCLFAVVCKENRFKMPSKPVSQNLVSTQNIYSCKNKNKIKRLKSITTPKQQHHNLFFQELIPQGNQLSWCSQRNELGPEIASPVIEYKKQRWLTKVGLAVACKLCFMSRSGNWECQVMNEQRIFFGMCLWY